jgi:hypothetical protein
MILPVLLLSGVLTAAQVADVRPEPYREAMRMGAVGSVTGRAMAEPSHPRGADEPIAQVSVTLLPRSEVLLGRLAEIRRQARGNPDLYRTSARAVVEARRALERSLAEAGGADLVRYLAATPDGSFELDRLPAGDWIVLAQHALFIHKESPGLKKSEREIFRRRPRMTGYYAVRLWLLELVIVAGEVAQVELTDRNVWMTAIEEERVLDAGR